MNRKPLFWHLYPAFLILSLLAVFLVATQIYSSFREHAIDDSKSDLINFAFTFDQFLKLEKLDKPTIEALASRRQIVLRLLNDRGEVVYTNRPNLNFSSQVLLQPKFIDSLIGQQNISILPVNAKPFLHFVDSVKFEGAPVYLHLSKSYEHIEDLLTPYRLQLWFSSILLFALIAIVSWFYTRSLVRPLELIQQKTEKMSEGEFSDKIPVQSLHIHELRALATSVNKMASQLFKRLRTITRQRNEKEAIFSSLTEGVLAVNGDGIVFSLNRAGAQLLEYTGDTFKGKSLPVVVRVPEMEDFIQQSLHIQSPQEIELKLINKEPEQHLLIRTSPLINENKQQDGVVVTFYDISELKRLEKVRKDFVANVSHELKTPLTSIQGYAETLLETDNLSAENQKQFLTTIYKHSTGLSQMVDELLNLAKYEETSDSQLRMVSVGELLQNIQAQFVEDAKLKNIQLELQPVSEGLKAKINSSLIRQAMSNLISNAIKYSDEGCKVQVYVSVDRDAEEIAIHVKDNGQGIEAKHISRIFERFYRIDPARHESTGGSGLGLAIVKHIAKSHGGRIEVESVLGQGSHFILTIPIT